MWFFVLGTRPEIVKLAPVIREAQRQRVPFEIVHTGQHYAVELDRVFFDELRLPRPRFALHAGSAPAGAQTARMVARLEPLLLKHRPSLVVVLGDTNSTLAGALAAVKIPGVKIAHVEAGSRSYQRDMPEEINRVLVDHASDVLLAANRDHADNLRREGLTRNVSVVGSTEVDAVTEHAPFARRRNAHKRWGLARRGYLLVTAHRAENTDDARRLAGIVEALNTLSEKIPVVFPLHPRTKNALVRNRLALAPSVRVLPPLPYLDFLSLLTDARAFLTDSGGAQEDAAVLRVPTFTFRDRTEWAETVRSGHNQLVDASPARIVRAVSRLLERPAVEKRIRAAPSPFRRGAARRCVRLCRRFDARRR